MPNGFEVMAMWNNREMEEAEAEIERAYRMDQLAVQVDAKADELCKQELFSHAEQMRRHATSTRNEASSIRQRAMARLDWVRKLTQTAAPDHILEEMGFNPSDFAPLAAAAAASRFNAPPNVQQEG